MIKWLTLNRQHLQFIFRHAKSKLSMNQETYKPAIITIQNKSIDRQTDRQIPIRLHICGKRNSKRNHVLKCVFKAYLQRQQQRLANECHCIDINELWYVCLRVVVDLLLLLLFSCCCC